METPSIEYFNERFKNLENKFEALIEINAKLTQQNIFLSEKVFGPIELTFCF